MKKSGLVIGSVVFATLVLYLLAYYFLPPPPPSPALVALFAAIAIVLVWALQWLFRKRSSKDNNHPVLLWVAVPLTLLCCHPAHAQTRAYVLCKFDTGPHAGTTEAFLTSPGIAVGDPCNDGAGSSGTVTSVRAIEASAGSAKDTAPAGTVNDTAPATAAPSDTAPAATAAPSEPGASAAPEPTESAEPPPPPPPPPPAIVAEAEPSLPRVTGTAVLLRGRQEDQGYGLYSYALLTHRPQPSELPRYRAFLMALVGLPTAQEVGGYVGKTRINITYFPLTAAPTSWDILTTQGRVDYVLAHYDYARGAVMLASLPERIGTGPVLVSVLKPLSSNQHPHPVLVQDLSKAQPVLMSDYVAEFVDQAAKDHFWEAITLEVFSLHLRNFLETAAVGLGMSKTAVDGWVHEDK